MSVEQTIANALRAAQPTLVLMSAKQIPGQDLYEVELTSGEVLYSTSDGQYFVYGSLFQATQGELVNITAKRSDEKRLALMDTNPLAANVELIVGAQADAFAAGLAVLTKLTEGKVWLCKAPGINAHRLRWRHSFALNCL